MSTTTRPQIGILCNSKLELCTRWSAPFSALNIDTYFIDPEKPLEDSEGTMDQFDALLLPGGDSNIHPAFVGRPIDNTQDLHDTLRDRLAIKLARRAYERDMPTLGICRGMQEIIVAFGGALQKLEDDLHATNYQYIGDFDKMNTPVHPITLCTDGKLFQLFENLVDQKNQLAVNSIHYEGLTQDGWNAEQSKYLRQLFQIEAMADDGVIEALSAKEKRFFIGVQAHFELQGDIHDCLYQDFAKHIHAYHAQRVSSTPEQAAHRA